MKNTKITTEICISYLILFLLVVSNAYCATTLPFDKEAVFCSYFKISGDKPSDQDIEDFCYCSGRPIYTSFKPSEMFSRQGIRRERERIRKKIESINDNSVFIWKFKVELSSKTHKSGKYEIKYGQAELPQATRYISPRLSKGGWRFLNRTLTFLINKNSGDITHNELDIAVSLRPLRTMYKYQKRNIADEELVLPIRYVIFQPVKVRILDETGNAL